MGRKIWIGLFVIITICLAYFFYNNKETWLIEDYTHRLNQKLTEKYGDKYDISAAYFAKNQKVPALGKYNKNKIIWLGNNIEKSALPNIAKYGIILVAHQEIKDILQSLGIKAEVFPLFITENKIVHTKKGKIFALVGNPPYLEDILIQEGMPYEHYPIDHLDEMRQNLKSFSAISVYPDSLENLDTIHPILLDSAYQGIPILSVSETKMLPLFSDNIYYYRDEQEAEKLVIRIRDGKSFDKAIKNQQFVKRYLTADKAFGRLEQIINKQKNYEKVIQIDIATFAGDYNSGDYWLGKDLALAFQNLGYQTREVYGNSAFKPDADVNIVMRGNLDDIKYNLNGQLNILYLAWSNLKINGIEERMPLDKYVRMVETKSKGYDLLVVSSKKIAEKLREKGVQAIYIPEFTNPNKFLFSPQKELAQDILFVGNFHFFREGPVTLYKNHLPISIYGKHWPADIKTNGEYINNNILNRYYSSAKIVLNDTKINMRDFGFMTTRLYDATASGAFVLSDYIPEIEETYGNCVPTWKTPQELIDLARYYLQHDDERRQKARCAQKITLENFTSDKIARQFDVLIKQYKGD